MLNETTMSDRLIFIKLEKMWRKVKPINLPMWMSIGLSIGETCMEVSYRTLAKTTKGSSSLATGPIDKQCEIMSKRGLQSHALGDTSHNRKDVGKKNQVFINWWTCKECIFHINNEMLFSDKNEYFWQHLWD